MPRSMGLAVRAHHDIMMSCVNTAHFQYCAGTLLLGVPATLARDQSVFQQRSLHACLEAC